MNQEIVAIKSLEQWQRAFKAHLAEPLENHKTVLKDKRRICPTCQQFIEKGKQL